MKNKKLVLAYCTENKRTAAKIEKDLNQAGYEFDHIVEPNEGNLGNRLMDITSPILLLVSDNFLKNVAAMERSMLWFQKIVNRGKILPVVIDGEYFNEKGEVEYEPTAFDRVSNVIKYMNHWQEEYLDLRREKRHAAKEDVTALEDKLRIVKNISAEIGEFLRYLKNVPHYHFDDFKNNNYQNFFKFVGDSNAYEIAESVVEHSVAANVLVEKPENQEASVNATNQDSEDTSQSLIDIINASSNDILSENNADGVEVEEEDDFDLSSIPGMDQLKERTPVVENGEKNGLDAVLDEINNGEEDTSSLESLVDKIMAEEDEPKEIVSDESANAIIDRVIAESGGGEPQKEQSVNEEIDIEAADFERLYEEASELGTDKPIEIIEDFEADKEEMAHEEEEEGEESIIMVEESHEKLEELFEISDNLEDDEEEEEVEIIKELNGEQNIYDIEETEEAVEEMIEEHEAMENEEIIIEDMEDDEEENEEDDLIIEDIEEEVFEEEINEIVEVEVTDAYISTAFQHFEKEEWEKGFETLEFALEKYPTDSDLRYQHALALARYRHDFRGASRQLEILLGHDQQHEDAYFLLAELAEMHKDHLTARNYYEKVATLNPDYPEIFYRLGVLTLYNFPDQKKIAANHFKEAIKKNKRNTDAIYRLGILMNEEFGKHWKAVKYFKKVLKIQPEHPFANYDLAILYHRLGDRALANIYYLKATEINPELKTPKNDEAFKYELLGDVEEPVFTSFGDGKDSILTELERDVERLEKKMNALNEEEELARLKSIQMQEVSEINPILDASIDIEQEIEEEITGGIEIEVPVLEEEEIVVPTIEPQLNLIAGFVDEVAQMPIIEPVKEEVVEETPTAEPVEDIVVEEKPLAKTVLITGATSGIGKATAEIFAKNGFRLIMTGRRMNRLEILKQSFTEKYGNDIHLLPFDVRNIEEVEAAINSLSDEWKSVDILINNAGLAKGFAPVHEGSLEHWNTMIDTNIKGLLYMTRAISPHMVERGSGHIINVASVAGKEVYPNGNVYCATKFAVDALTKGMRMDLVKHNIRVSQVSPAHVEETEFAVVRFDGDAERAKIYEDFKPLTSRDVAESIYFLASQPKHVNILDIVLAGTQQASAMVVDRSGRG